MKFNAKTLFTAAAISVCAGFAFAEKGPVYISPNNDGVKDSLEVPLKIKEKRYVESWSFIISDEKGNVVRTIGNKVQNDEKITFKSFFKKLVSPKTGVDIPSSVVWNGFDDNGNIVKDGKYYYQFSATDDNGYSATTSKLLVYVDNTPPEVNISPISAADKNFGEGAKSVLRIKQNGSLEDEWTANFFDASGNVVYTKKFVESEPLNIEWNGSDNNGSIVADGVYTYEISATDRAGNKSEKAQVTNIIYSAEKPQTDIAIDGSKYFSPQGNSSRKTMNLAVTIPLPKSTVNNLTEWKIEIVDKNDSKVYMTYSGDGKQALPVKNLAFNGLSSEGIPLPEGEYKAKVTAKYSNGYEPAPVYSPLFVLDNTAPKATASLENKNAVFNGQKAVKITHSYEKEEAYTGEKTWTGQIVDEKGAVVRQYDFGNDLPADIQWDFDNNGQFASDGNYKYILSVTELAGNSAVFEEVPFELNTAETVLMVSVSPSAFSPNGNSSQTTLTVKAKVDENTAKVGIDSYTFKIVDSKTNAVVWSTSGKKSVPESFTWNGKSNAAGSEGIVCADGTYKVLLETVAVSGTGGNAESSLFTIDTKAPAVTISSPYTVFSPDNVSSRQTVDFTADSSVESKWTGTILNAKGKAVRNYNWTNTKIPSFKWDGTDDNGNKVENGIYTLKVASKDAAGNTGSAEITNIKLDARPVSAYLTAEYDGISPNNDGVLETQKFTVHTTVPDGISAWTFDIIDEKTGKSVRHFSDAEQANLPAEITWSGESPNEKNELVVLSGTFKGKLHIEYEKGNTADAVSSTFVCTPFAPKLSVRTAPEYFSPDNDGNDDELFIRLDCQTLANEKTWSFTIKDPEGNQFWKTSGKGKPTQKMIWDGRGNDGDTVLSATDYSYEFTVTDDLGMTSSVSGVIKIDVLVIIDGDKLKIQVPSITFRGDAADFCLNGEIDSNGKKVTNGITKEQKESNEKVIKRIAEILKKFDDYHITVEGNSNPVTNLAAEATEDGYWGRALIPLSQERAEYVVSRLIKYGVPKSKLSAKGNGAQNIIADPKDDANKWKNRRVDFILTKPTK